LTFLQPTVYIFNGARDLAGIANITSFNPVLASNPLEFLIDDRRTTNVKFATAETDHFIDVDLLGNTFVDHLIIPEGHTLNGIACRLLHGTSFPPASTALSTFTPTSDAAISLNFPIKNSRFWRFHMDTIGAHELPGLWITFETLFTQGFDIVGATDSFVSAFKRFEQPSGISPTLKTGARRQIIEMEYSRALAGGDLANMDLWIAQVGMDKVFYFRPSHFHSGTPIDPIPAKFLEDPLRQWGNQVPARDVDRKTFRLSVIESLD